MRRLLAAASRRAWVPLSYALLATGLFASAWSAPSRSYVGASPDALQQMWFLGWTAHALTHHGSLLYTTAINAPHGVNLLWNTAMILPGIVVAPVTMTLGPVVAYNTLITAAVAGSAWMAFVAIRRVTQSPSAGWLGGLLFGFSPYMVAQSLGLDLVLMAYLPASLWFFVEIVVVQRRRWWALGAAFGLVTSAQFFVFQELIAGVALAFAAACLVAAMLWTSQVASHWRYAARSLVTTALVVVASTGWALWYQVAGPGTPPGLTEVANSPGVDLLALVTPTANQALAPGFAQHVSATFTAQATGAGGYFGIPLLAVAILVAWRYWDWPAVRLAAVLALVLLTLALGPSASVGGRSLPVPLPWSLAQHVPLLDNLVPLRLVAYAVLPVAVIVACGWSRRAHMPRPERAAFAALTVLVAVSWIPALPRPATDVPGQGGLPRAIRDRIPDGGTVLFAPDASFADADAMYYQMQAGFAFRLAAGYAYGVQRNLPLADVLDAVPIAAVTSATKQLETAGDRATVIDGFRAGGISVVVVPPGFAHSAYAALFSNVFQRTAAIEADGLEERPTRRAQRPRSTLMLM